MGAGMKQTQVGWLTPDFKPGPRNNLGVGDDEYGWAVDGHRFKKFHNGGENALWTRSWHEGDIIGCALDIDKGQMMFSLNGEWNRHATFQFPPNGQAFFP